MRKLLIGTVNGKAFNFYKNGKVDCKDSELSRMISSQTLVAIEHAKQKIKEGSKDRLACIVRDELEDCPEAEIKVNQCFDYESGTTLIFYYHIPRNKNFFRKPFLKGKFKNGSKFKVLVNHSVEVLDAEGKPDEEYTNLLQSFFEDVFNGTCQPHVPSINTEIYKVLKAGRIEMIIKHAYFYSYEPVHDFIYFY